MIDKLNNTIALTEFPTNIKFKYGWRSYQQRVLDELNTHLEDKHLHVIAPPGSGKTVLGLEVAIRLNKPVLILVPTLAIRNQWIHRFTELFLQVNEIPDWISNDIRRPGFMTVATYQGLHAACNNLTVDEELDEEEEDNLSTTEKTTDANFDTIVELLRVKQVGTVVVDEAHHLKNDWWKTLIKIKDQIDPVIVGLTATPPYDVSPLEWQRYSSLNGVVDTEISVPELVVEGDLCPHQDYVFFTTPSEAEMSSIVHFRQNIEKLYLEIKTDETIIKAVESHPIWIAPQSHLDWIYNNLSCYSACLIFLNENKRVIPVTHLDVIGDKKIIVPALNYDWLAILLDFYLFKNKEHFTAFDEHRKLLENRLRRYGALERRQIDFSGNKRTSGILASSISKLNGIKEIVDFEYKQLGTNLRLVILSDFIRKEFLIEGTENNLELNKIGVIPIFEKLRRENTDKKKIGVLSGSLIIIPESALAVLTTFASDLGISQIVSERLPYDCDYLIIRQTEASKHSMVHIVTQVFQLGEIEVLIGTKSLLGEGWDAPAINALILASFVGSFVLSNQMRGRAIRTQRGNAEKTGNIWHIACVDPTVSLGGEDMELLKRRFGSFVGISFHADGGIENGIQRLNISKNNIGNVEEKNAEMFAFAGERNFLKERWNKALKHGINLVEEIKIPFQEEKKYTEVKSLYLTKTIAHLLAALGSGSLLFVFEAINGLGRFVKHRHIKTLKDLYVYIAIIAVIGIVIFGRLALKTLRLYLSYRDISKDIQQIGEVVLRSMINNGLVQSDSSGLKVNASINKQGDVFCHLEGGTTFEKSSFIKCLIEIVSPIDNPRYVIIRKNLFARLIKQRDYHSVPEILGQQKKSAESFQNLWLKLVGNCELIYTRTLEGRKLLLKSRVKSLAAQFEDKIEHINKWK